MPCLQQEARTLPVILYGSKIMSHNKGRRSKIPGLKSSVTHVPNLRHKRSIRQSTYQRDYKKVK